MAVVVPVVRVMRVVVKRRHGQLAVAARQDTNTSTSTAAAARKRRRRKAGRGGRERVRRRKEHEVVVGVHWQQHELGRLGQRQTQVALVARWIAARMRAQHASHGRARPDARTERGAKQVLVALTLLALSLLALLPLGL